MTHMGFLGQGTQVTTTPSPSGHPRALGLASETPLQMGRAWTVFPHQRSTGSQSLEQSPCCPAPPESGLTRNSQPQPHDGCPCRDPRCPCPWGLTSPTLAPPRPQLPPGAKKVLALRAEQVRGAGPSVRLRARWAGQHRPYKAVECVRGGAGQGGALARPYLALSHGREAVRLPRVGWGCDPRRRCGGNGGPLSPDCHGRGIYLGRPFLPSETGRRTSRIFSSEILPPTFPQRPRCLAHSRGRASFHQTKYGFFPSLKEEAYQMVPTYSHEKVTSQAPLVWGLHLGIRTATEQPTSATSLPFQALLSFL